MNRVQNSPNMTSFKGKSASLMKQSIGGVTTMMGTTLDATASNGMTLDATRSSPFRDTITKGMITGAGLLNHQTISKMKKTN